VRCRHIPKAVPQTDTESGYFGGVLDPPSQGAPGQVTRILGELQAGEREAPGQTLQATELVHEAYVRLVGSTDPGWQGRAHFFGAAARAMRDILADHLQRKGSLKRGGHFRRVGEDTAAQLSCDGPDDDVLAVEEALQDFERKYPRKAEVVTLSFFGGLTAAEIAEVLGVSARTVEREWRFAKAWLNARLADGEERT
jgi:RNA polymerase sigma factor (TIGR02999 family)